MIEVKVTWPDIYFLQVPPPAALTLFTHSQLCMLVHTTECQRATGDARNKLVSYHRVGEYFVLDLTSIENAVERIETKGVIEGGEWVFVDQSNDAARTTLQCANNGDQEYEDD